MTSRRLLDPVGRVLLDAANYIEHNGHHKGDYMGERTIGGKVPVCAIGAISLVSADNRIARQAIIRFRGSLAVSIPKWNDMPERTPEEVVAMLRKAALAEDHEHAVVIAADNCG